MLQAELLCILDLWYIKPSANGFSIYFNVDLKCGALSSSSQWEIISHLS